MTIWDVTETPPQSGSGRFATDFKDDGSRLERGFVFAGPDEFDFRWPTEAPDCCVEVVSTNQEPYSRLIAGCIGNGTWVLASYCEGDLTRHVFPPTVPIARFSAALAAARAFYANE